MKDASGVPESCGVVSRSSILWQGLLPDPKGGQGMLDQEAVPLAPVPDDLGERRQEPKVGVNAVSHPEGVGGRSES